MQITSKDKATAILKNLIRTSQGILNTKKMYEEKLEEVYQLEKDSYIGLKLTDEQDETLKSKKGYELIIKFMNDTIKNNKLFEITNEDEFVKLCVECIFLEKKDVKPEPKQEVAEIKKVVEEKKVVVPKKEVELEVEVKEKEFVEEKEDYGLSKVRIPYAWKSAQFFEGGERERKREHGKKTAHVPAKEYRGFHTKKGPA
ncbi:hypothetical protein BDAP_002091 [Binucleata daphniae]